MVTEVKSKYSTSEESQFPLLYKGDKNSPYFIEGAEDSAG